MVMMRRRRWTVRSRCVCVCVCVSVHRSPPQVLTLAIVAVMFIFNVLFIVDLSVNHHQTLHSASPPHTWQLGRVFLCPQVT